MHSDPKLVSRVEAVTKDWRGLAATRMFGGIAWLLHGKMCVGIWHDSLVVRCDPTEWPKHLAKPYVREMDITGRSMKGWLLVEPPALRTRVSLKRWLEVSRSYVSTLPAK
ncbi:MAG: TfoX/Sxy family protein [Verrucomicrobia bacterium]|nr:TfoX/Sxy family protein [Verrucomicrobiota bacterium]